MAKAGAWRRAVPYVPKSGKRPKVTLPKRACCPFLHMPTYVKHIITITHNHESDYIR